MILFLHESIPVGAVNLPRNGVCCACGAAVPSAPDLPEESATQSPHPPEDANLFRGGTPYTVEPMHRLTALEYQRSARDLLGIRLRDDLPPDEVTFG